MLALCGHMGECMDNLLFSVLSSLNVTFLISFYKILETNLGFFTALYSHVWVRVGRKGVGVEIPLWIWKVSIAGN